MPNHQPMRSKAVDPAIQRQLKRNPIILDGNSPEDDGNAVNCLENTNVIGIPISQISIWPSPADTLDDDSCRRNSFAKLFSRDCNTRSSSFLISIAVHLLALLILSMLVFQNAGKSIISLEFMDSTGGGQIERASFELASEFDETMQYDLVIKERPEVDIVYEFDFPNSDIGAEDSSERAKNRIIGSQSNPPKENLSTSDVGDGNSAKFFSTRARGNKFIYIVDRSSSMHKGGYRQAGLNFNFSRFDVARIELQNSIESLQPHQEFHVVLFNQNLKHFSPTPVNATTQNKKKLRRWLWSQDATGLSDPRSSLTFAYKTKPDAIFLLGDGAFERGGPLLSIDDVTKRIKNVITEIPIHTVALEDVSAQANMKQLSKISSGQFKFLMISQYMADVKFALNVNQRFSLNLIDLLRTNNRKKAEILFENSNFDFIKFAELTANQKLSTLKIITLCQLIVDFQNEIGGVTNQSQALLQRIFNQLDQESDNGHQPVSLTAGSNEHDCEQCFQRILRGRRQKAKVLEEAMLKSWVDPFGVRQELIQPQDQLKIAKQLFALYPETEVANRAAKKYGLAGSNVPQILQLLGY